MLRQISWGHGAREKPMPSRLGLALLGLTVGGATFLFSGVAAFLSIASLQSSIDII